jgi:hypothetical protein
MATLTKREDVTEVVVVEKGGYTLELSREEAEGLGVLLRGGVGSSTLSILGLLPLMSTLREEGLGNSIRRHSLNWISTAQHKDRR